MSKQLEELLQRIPDWPERAKEEAVLALNNIEERVVAWESRLSAGDRAKLAALPDMVRGSIAEGGDYSPDDIDAMIDEMAAQSTQAR